MIKCTSLLVVAAVVGLAPIVPISAFAQPKDALSIANDDSVFIDAKTFKIVPGSAGRNVSALIKKLDARDLGPGAIVFRSGGKLYMVAGRSVLPRYGTDRDERYGSDRDARYGTDRDARYGTDRDARYGSDRDARYGSDRDARYGTDRDDRYGSDRKVSDQSNRIRVEYAPPQNPDQQKVYDLIKEHRVLETLQKILSPFRFPSEVKIKTMGCDGMINSWYNTDDSVPTVHMCYELLQDVLQNVPKETTPTGITPKDAVIGQFLFWTLHEFGHAVFDIYQVPLFASEEDSADRFAVYVMLQFGKDQSRRLIGGAAYAANEIIKNYDMNSNVEKPLGKYSSVHGLPEQRFFNLLCLAYGADPKLFADVVENGFLPKRRAGNCEYEYQSFARAFRGEIGGPHVDKQMARTILDTTWLPPQSGSQPGSR
jgi:hypothetical protein